MLEIWEICNFGHQTSLQLEITVMDVLAEIPPWVAVIIAMPGATPVARPPLVTLATDEFDELQVTCVVISWFCPSEYVPVAVNCWMDPTSMPGVTTMEDRAAEVTVRVMLTEILPEVAVMVAVPGAMAMARPLLLTVATDVFDELQVTCVAISWLVPSEYVPMAANCWATPTGMIGLAGVTAKEERVAEVTVRAVLAEIPPEAAVMVAVPAATAVAMPLLLIVATDVFEELQVTWAMGILWLVPSEYVAMALNCWATPTGMLGLAGVIAIEDRVAEVTVRVKLPETAPEVTKLVPEAVIFTLPAAPAVTRPLLSTVAIDVFDEIQVTCAAKSWFVPSE